MIKVAELQMMSNKRMLVDLLQQSLDRMLTHCSQLTAAVYRCCLQDKTETNVYRSYTQVPVYMLLDCECVGLAVCLLWIALFLNVMILKHALQCL